MLARLPFNQSFAVGGAEAWHIENNHDGEEAYLEYSNGGMKVMLKQHFASQGGSSADASFAPPTQAD
eukprot:8462376-Alexandrium_andersonii.AAC.1